MQLLCDLLEVTLKHRTLSDGSVPLCVQKMVLPRLLYYHKWQDSWSIWVHGLQNWHSKCEVWNGWYFHVSVVDKHTQTQHVHISVYETVTFNLNLISLPESPTTFTLKQNLHSFSLKWDGSLCYLISTQWYACMVSNQHVNLYSLRLSLKLYYKQWSDMTLFWE